MPTFRDEPTFHDSLTASDQLLYRSGRPTLVLKPVHRPYSLAINPDQFVKALFRFCSRAYFKDDERYVDALLFS